MALAVLLPGASEMDKGAPGSMLIGPCVTDGKLSLATSKGCCCTCTNQEELRTGDQLGA